MTDVPLVDTLRFDSVWIKSNKMYVNWWDVPSARAVEYAYNNNLDINISKKMLECYVYSVPYEILQSMQTILIPLYDTYIAAIDAMCEHEDESDKIFKNKIDLFGNILYK